MARGKLTLRSCTCADTCACTCSTSPSAPRTHVFCRTPPAHTSHGAHLSTYIRCRAQEAPAVLVQLQLRAPKVPVQEGAGALEAPAVLVQGVHSASWCTVLCGAGHMCGRGAPARCTHVARRARSTLSHIYSCVTVRDGLKLTIRPSYRTRLFDSKFSCLHAYTQLWKIKNKK